MTRPTSMFRNAITWRARLSGTGDEHLPKLFWTQTGSAWTPLKIGGKVLTPCKEVPY